MPRALKPKENRDSRFGKLDCGSNPKREFRIESEPLKGFAGVFIGPVLRVGRGPRVQSRGVARRPSLGNGPKATGDAIGAHTDTDPGLHPVQNARRRV